MLSCGTVPSMETKICVRCHEEKPLSQFKLTWKGHGENNAPGYAERNPAGVRRNQCITCLSRWYTSGRKLAFLKAFDFKCSCCGERNPYFLTLDHVNNDGGDHRRSLSTVRILSLARREKYDRTKWDCLCMNCNFAKGHYGECPHKSGLTPEVIIARYEQDVRPIGRKHVDTHKNGSQQGFMRPGFDPRRMQLNRRALKPCIYCGEQFGTNEMTRHKREVHAEEMKAKRAEVLSLGRQKRAVA
jgi:hypothetical protein